MKVTFWDRTAKIYDHFIKKDHRHISKCKCDYSICGDRDEYLKESPEYVDGCSLLFIRRD